MHIIDITEIDLGDEPEITFNDIVADLWMDGIKDAEYFYCTYEQKRDITGFNGNSVRYVASDKTMWPDHYHDCLVYDSVCYSHKIICPLDLLWVSWSENGRHGEPPKAVWYEGHWHFV